MLNTYIYFSLAAISSKFVTRGMHINSVDGKGNNKLEYKSSLNYLTNHTSTLLVI